MNVKKTIAGLVCSVVAMMSALADDIPMPEMEAFAINGRFNIHLIRSDAANYGYEVQLSADGENWTDVYEQTGWRGRNDGVDTWICGERQDFAGDRYLRLRALGDGGESSSEWTEAVLLKDHHPTSGNYIGALGTYQWGGDGQSFGWRAFDGIGTTFYNPSDGTARDSDNMYLGQDLGTVTAVKGVSYHICRTGLMGRMRGAFQIANRPDFTDAVTMYQISEDVEYRYCHVDFGTTYFGRYVRFCIAGQSDCITPAEIEFCSSPVKVANGDVWGDAYAVVSWESDDAEVYRAYSPTGPWTLIATVSEGVRTYTDEDVVYGAVAYYKVGDEIAAYTRMHRLDSKAAGVRADGASIIWNGSYYPGSADVGTMFDGNTSTCPDILTNPNVGIDFGRAVYVALARIYPRENNQLYSRTDNVVIFASNGDWTSDYSHPISDTLRYGDYDSFRWSTLGCDSSVAYRYAYAHNMAADSYGNWGELEFYGWTEDDLSTAAAMPYGVALSLVSGGRMQVAWSCVGSPDRYEIERSVFGGGEWIKVGEIASGAAGYAAKTFVDSGLTSDVRYAYRVTAVYTVPLPVAKTSAEADLTSYEPVSLAIYSDQFGKGLPTVSWVSTDAVPSTEPTHLYRSESVNGPWKIVATAPAGETSAIDKTAKFGGITYHYRVGPAGNAALKSEVLPFMRMRRLERKSAGELADGVAIVNQGTPWNGDPAGAASVLFDGDIQTSANLDGTANPRVGIDFGAENRVYVVRARLYPRNINDELIYGRTDGVRIFGIDENWDSGAATAVSDVIDYGERVFKWFTLDCDCSTPYRYFFAYNTRRESYANWTELEFYGWTEQDLLAKDGMIILVR